MFANATNKSEATKKLLTYIPKALPADEYKKYTGSGNVKKENVKSRIKGMLNICGVIERELFVEEIQPEEVEQVEVLEVEVVETENLEVDITDAPEELDDAEENQEDIQTILNIIDNVNVA